MSPEVKEIFVQENETGHVTNKEGVLGAATGKFTAVQTDAQQDRLTAGQKLRVVKDAGSMEIDADAIGQQIQRLRVKDSVLKFVNVGEENRHVVEALKRIHGDHFEFVMRKDTAADLSRKDTEEEAGAESDVLESAAA